MIFSDYESDYEFEYESDFECERGRSREIEYVPIDTYQHREVDIHRHQEVDIMDPEVIVEIPDVFRIHERYTRIAEHARRLTAPPRRVRTRQLSVVRQTHHSHRQRCHEVHVRNCRCEETSYHPNGRSESRTTGMYLPVPFSDKRIDVDLAVHRRSSEHRFRSPSPSPSSRPGRSHGLANFQLSSTASRYLEEIYDAIPSSFRPELHLEIKNGSSSRCSTASDRRYQASLVYEARCLDGNIEVRKWESGTSSKTEDCLREVREWSRKSGPGGKKMVRFVEV